MVFENYIEYLKEATFPLNLFQGDINQYDLKNTPFTDR